MFKKLANKLKQHFCKYEWAVAVKSEGLFFNLRGERFYHVCKKCGKVKKYVFLEHEGMGWK